MNQSNVSKDTFQMIINKIAPGFNPNQLNNNHSNANMNSSIKK